jgi:outer membrane protein assembly factor BamD (BamD/ComL family)
LQRLADEQALEREQNFEIERRKKQELRETYQKTAQNKLRMQAIEAQLEEEENDDLRMYAEAKKKMAIMKREREMAIHRDKEEKRDKMMSYLGNLLKHEIEDQDLQIARQIEKNEEKQARDDYDKMVKRQNEIMEIDKYRRETVIII